MPAAPRPEKELARLSALIELDILDTSSEVEFDALVKAASLVCNAPISLISLVDAERQWFKANVGLPGTTETPRELAFCAYAIHDDDIFEVEDASKDPRFIDNPLVTSNPDIRFYAGAPLTLQNGARVGTLCVIDTEPRKLNEHQRATLQWLGKAAAKALEGRRALLAERQIVKQISEVANQLSQSEARFRIFSEASPCGIFATDANGSCTYTNRRWQEIYGLSLEE
ncbi:MAG: GAF domain-containing protein, partial [Oleibacter sp.]|nr:GAF domain-containing protein [Thalassolituus sp.]